jgi:hypothetical protein
MPGTKQRRRKKRVRSWIAVTVAVLFAAATTSWTLPRTLILTDQDGAPVSDAYVRYHYEGELVNPVHPVTYVARGSVITRADAEGRIRIPFRLHLRSPAPLSTPPWLYIDTVYTPRLHNAFGPIAERSTSRPGVFTLDEEHERVTIFDVSGDPERWERSLSDLFDSIRSTVSTSAMAPADPDDASTAASARELIAHLRREYDAFLAKHGSAPRGRAPAPAGVTAAARQARLLRTNADLAREPLWGPYIERMWKRNLQELDRLEAGLKPASSIQ